jgi:Cu+-exporting ATPase
MTSASEPTTNEMAWPSFRSLYALTGIVGALVAADLLFWWLGYEQLRNPWGVNLSLIAAVLGGARIVYAAVATLLEGDVGADLALAIATVAALVLREYWVAAEVVLIAMVGESLEALTFSRTQRELRRIFDLRSRTVHLRRGDRTIDVPTEEVKPGDVVVVRPGERVPVDGAVLAGRSTVDQSTLTGESLPIDKGPKDEVFAGTMNQFGALDVRVNRVGDDTTLGQVIRMVAQARRNKADVERTADRLARYFLPFVLSLALITFAYTNGDALRALSAGTATDATRWIWMPTLAVLVVACPCALVLATPAAMMAAVAWMARRGVLTTGGAAVERLAMVDRFAFDKTGTLTQGELEIGTCVAFDENEPAQIIGWAAAAEQSSEHLIAQVIVRAAQEQGLLIEPVDEFQALPGAGVTARLAGANSVEVLVGNRRLMLENGVPLPDPVERALEQMERAGQSPLLVAVDAEVAGAISVRDTVREEAAEVVRQLHQLGIAEIVLLTGDRDASAQQVARAVGIERVVAELRPDEKANWLADWSGECESAGRPRIAMVGDGVNDAPALATADVGLALGGVGSDIAAEAGDLILMGAPLSPLPGLVRLARETVRIIRQNIVVFAFGVNLAGVVLTGWVMPTWSEAWMARSPVAAALFHQVGSVLVLLNAMRLLWFERWNRGWLGRLEMAASRQCGQLFGWLRPVVDLGRWTWRCRGACLRFALVLAAAVYLGQILVFVQPDEVALVKRFGRFHAVLPPGPHLRLPPPWDTITREKPHRVRTVLIGLKPRAGGDDSVTSQGDSLITVQAPVGWSSLHQVAESRDEDVAQILTGDQSLVELLGTVQFRVADLAQFRFGVREPERVLQSLAEGVLREIVARQPLLRDVTGDREAKEILASGRGTLEREVRDRLQARVVDLRLGIEILPEGVCLQDLHPPRNVVAAFRDVSSAFKEKERMRNEATAYYREKLIQAAGENAWRALSERVVDLDDAEWTELWDQLRPQLAGEAVEEINGARAFAEEKTQLADGEAISFRQKQSAHAAEPKLTEQRLFLELLEDAMPGKPKLILDRRHGGRRHLLMGLPKEASGASLPIYDPGSFDE